MAKTERASTWHMPARPFCTILVPGIGEARHMSDPDQGFRQCRRRLVGPDSRYIDSRYYATVGLMQIGLSVLWLSDTSSLPMLRQNRRRLMRAVTPGGGWPSVVLS